VYPVILVIVDSLPANAGSPRATRLEPESMRIFSQNTLFFKQFGLNQCTIRVEPIGSNWVEPGGYWTINKITGYTYFRTQTNFLQAQHDFSGGKRVFGLILVRMNSG